MEINKVVHMGRYNDGYRKHAVFCKVTFKDGKLLISGVEGPRRSGSCSGACGQIVMHLKDTTSAEWELAEGWTWGTLQHFLKYWDEWHLNDMTAGSPRQMAFLKANSPQGPFYPVSHYDKALVALQEAGLSPDTEYLHTGKPYAYGHAWLRVDVPTTVLDFLQALPDSPIKPAWV